MIAHFIGLNFLFVLTAQFFAKVLPFLRLFEKVSAITELLVHKKELLIKLHSYANILLPELHFIFLNVEAFHVGNNKQFIAILRNLLFLSLYYCYTLKPLFSWKSKDSKRMSELQLNVLKVCAHQKYV